MLLPLSLLVFVVILSGVVRALANDVDLLCVYRGDQWKADKPLSAILPWITEWLFYYELWLPTGQWYGGGHDLRTGRKDARTPDHAEDTRSRRTKHSEYGLLGH